MAASKVEQRGVDRLEVPWIAEADRVGDHAGLGTDAGDVVDELIDDRDVLGLVQQLEAVDDEVLVATDIEGRPPTLPALGPAAIEAGADETDDHAGATPGLACGRGFGRSRHAASMPGVCSGLHADR